MVQSSTKDILNDEIKSWEHFEYAPGEENTSLLQDVVFMVLYRYC
jgi:hypothetical protein